MTHETPPENDWMAPITRMLDAHAWRGQYLMAIQTYRPDVVRMIAHRLHLALRDFRAEYMAPRCWQATDWTLDELDQVVAVASTDQGLVLQNVEALLAAKSTNERVSWLSQFVEIESGHPVLVPLSLFFAEAPTGCPRVAWIDPVELPEEKLLTRLALQ